MSYFKKYTFDKSKFKLGMRTFKTGIAVFLVLMIFGFFGWKGLQIGALTAVFSLREDFDKSVHFGTSRILGNSIGGFYALIFFLLNNFFQQNTPQTVNVVIYKNCYKNTHKCFKNSGKHVQNSFTIWNW